MVDNVFADDQGYIMVQVSGPPATYHGEFHAYLDSGGVLETRSYRGAALRSEVEARVALVGSLLLDWDAVDVAQYTSEDVKTGSEKRPAYLELRRAYHYEDPHVTDFGDYVQGKLHDWNDDPDCAQALACCLWDSLPTPGCSTPATVFIRLCNLRPGKEMERTTAASMRASPVTGRSTSPPTAARPILPRALAIRTVPQHTQPSATGSCAPAGTCLSRCVSYGMPNGTRRPPLPPPCWRWENSTPPYGRRRRRRSSR